MAINELKDLEDCLDYISRRKRLKFTRVEEKELYVKARNGDLKAKEELIISNLGYLYTALTPFDYRAEQAEVSLADIASELIEDVIEKRFDTFDPNQKTRLGTYLFNKKFISPKIKQRIQRHSKRGMTSSGLKSKPFYYSITEEENNEKDKVDTATQDDLFLHHAIANLQRKKPTSADEARDKIDYETIQEEILGFSEREQRIINEHYLEEKSLSQIARELNITHQRVNQIHAELIKRLRKKLR